MTEPVLSYSPVGARPRITRDRTAVVLAVIAAIAFLPMILEWMLGAWIEGRSNCRIGGPFGFGCQALPIWLVAAVWLLIRAAVKMHAGSPAQRVRWIVMVLLVWLPMLDFLSGSSLGRSLKWFDPGFLPGIASWVNANVDVQTIRQWSATVPLDASQPAADLRRWVASPPAGPVVIAVPKANWPSNLASLELEEMYILSDRSAVVMFWGVDAGAWGYTRMVVVQSPGATPFSHYSYWPASCLVQNGVWVYVRYPH